MPVARSLFALLVMPLIVGCAPVPKPESTGVPVYKGIKTVVADGFTSAPLPASIEIARQKYLNEAVPIFFFVEKNGEYAAWWRCKDTGRCNVNLNTAVVKAKAACEDRKLGAECRLDMVGETRLGAIHASAPNIGYTVVPAEKTDRRGAAKAVGKILYFPGYAGWSWNHPNVWRQASDGKVAPVLRALGSSGWDVDVVNILPHDRYRLWDRDDAYAGLIEDQIAAARAAGYQRVAVIGQSRGGAEILRALEAGSRPDAVVLSEPSAIGPIVGSDGKRKPRTQERISFISEPLAKAAEVPVLLTYFDQSRWFGNVPRTAFNQVRAARKAPLVLIARPDGYVGHGAMFTARFRRQYTDCLDGFLKGEVTADNGCRANPVNEADPSNHVTRAQLEANGFRKATGGDLARLRSGVVLCAYDVVERAFFDRSACAKFESTQRSIARRKARPDEPTNVAPVSYAQHGYCKFDNVRNGPPKVCNTIYLKGDLVATSTDGINDVYFYRRVSDRGLPPTEWTCTSKIKDGYVCSRQSTGPLASL